jgi:hypothetical protein
MLGDFFREAVNKGALDSVVDRGQTYQQAPDPEPPRRPSPQETLAEDPLADYPAVGNSGVLDGEDARDALDSREAAPEPRGNGSRFTSIREEDLDDPRLRRVYQTLQQDFQAKLKQIEGVQEQGQMVNEHGALLKRIKEDDGLRGVILDYLHGQRSPGRQEAPAEPARPETVLSRDEFPDIDDDAFQGLENLAQRFMRSVDQKYGQPVREHGKTVERVNGLLEQLEAQREMNDLSALHPGWREHVDPAELARMKKEYPNVPVTKLYRMLDYDKAPLRAKREVFAKGSTRRPMAANGGRGADRSQEREAGKLKGITNFEDAIQAAIEELGY